VVVAAVAKLQLCSASAQGFRAVNGFWQNCPPRISWSELKVEDPLGFWASSIMGLCGRRCAFCYYHFGVNATRGTGPIYGNGLASHKKKS